VLKGEYAKEVGGKYDAGNSQHKETEERKEFFIFLISHI